MLLANVALPSFIGHWIVFLILMPVVAGIEGAILTWFLKIPYQESLVTAGHANWRSTVVGLPMAWCLAWVVGLVPAGALAYLLPPSYHDPSSQLIVFTLLTGGFIPNQFSPVAIAAGNLLILCPYYLVTVRIERKVVVSRHPQVDPYLIARAVRVMNRVTYAILALLVLWWLGAAIATYAHRT